MMVVQGTSGLQNFSLTLIRSLLINVHIVPPAAFDAKVMNYLNSRCVVFVSASAQLKEGVDQKLLSGDKDKGFA